MQFKSPNRKIILASVSPRRKMLLKSMGLKFKVIPSSIKEGLKTVSQYPPRWLAITLALRKALDIFQKNKNPETIKNSFIIGADTIVTLGKEVLGKPKNKKDAFRILSLLSGKRHFVFTGLAIIDTNNKSIVTDCIKSSVYFKKLSEKSINAYLNTSEPWDKAGAYAFQGKGRFLISKFSGPKDNIIGLPRKKLLAMLKYLDKINPP